MPVVDSPNFQGRVLDLQCPSLYKTLEVVCLVNRRSNSEYSYQRDVIEDSIFLIAPSYLERVIHAHLRYSSFGMCHVVDRPRLFLMRGRYGMFLLLSVSTSLLSG